MSAVIASTALAVVGPRAASAATVTPLFAVNAGGAAISSSTPPWSADTGAPASSFVNAAATGNSVFTTGTSVNMTDPSVPAGTPMAVFQSERFDPPGGSDMTWTFPAAAGTYQVKLFFAEIYFTQAGKRVFNVSINGSTVLSNYDTVADVGAFKGVVKTFPVTTTSATPTITITFAHVVENPAVKGVEVDQLGSSPNQLGFSPTSLAFPSTTVGSTATQTVQLTNIGATGDPSITVSGASVSGPNANAFSASFPSTPPIVLAPGASTTMTVTYTPKIVGAESATVTVGHSGINAVAVGVSGTGAPAAPPGLVAAINAGGSALSPAWAADTAPSPSTFVNAAATGNAVFTTASSIDMSDPSVPAGTPMGVFQSERYDPAGGSDMTWTFPAAAGVYQVKLFFAEIYFTQPGKRVFNVVINGTTVLTNYDTVADVGPLKGVVKTFSVTTTSASPTITVSFPHVTENPSLKGIEVDRVGSVANQLGFSPTTLAFPSTTTGSTATKTVQLTNNGSTGDPSITITAASVSGPNANAFSASFPSTPPIVLAPGASTTMTVTYAPKIVGAESATVTVAHSGTNAVAVPVSGTGAQPAPPGLVAAINAGGTAITSSLPAWSADTEASPSSFGNAVATGNGTFTTSSSIDMSDPSVPAGMPMAVFQSERYDPAGGPDMTWTFPAAAGAYQVKVYMAEIYFTQPGKRVFNVVINGTTVLNNYDTVADVGAFKGVIKTFPVTTTSTTPTITVSFPHVTENPSIKGIEVDRVGGIGNQLGFSPLSLAFPTTTIGSTGTKTVQLTNNGSTGDPSITITGSSVSGSNANAFSAAFSSTLPIVLAPGASATMTVTYGPKVSGPESATVLVSHSGANVVAVGVSGTGAPPPPPGLMAAINAGGAAISSSSPAWSGDTDASPSPFVNAALTGNGTYTTPSTVDMSDASVPVGTPMAVFQSERYDAAGSDDMTWSFPAAAGSYQVKLFLAEIYFTQPGQRVFNVVINGSTVLSNYDTVADVGPFKGVVKTFPVTTSGANPNITITFTHVIENPTVKGIEIISNAVANQLGFSTTSVAFGSVSNGQPTSSILTLTNVGATGDPAITVTGLTVTGPDAHQFAAELPRVDATGRVVTGPPVVIPPGGSIGVTVWFAPATGARSATLTVASSASNSSQQVNLSGTGLSGNPVGFGKSDLVGVAPGVAGDVIRFGPDGRLYVGEFSGLIHAYTIARNGPNNYAVTATETIDLIKQIPNHDDNGALNPSVTMRMITGMLFTGTAANMHIYVASSDPRIGGGNDGIPSDVDTNASIISRLDRVNGTWTRTDLVRGLPRSEESHAANGMAIDPATNTLYLVEGGNTNEGAPSHNFNYLPEYAYSAAVLKIDLNAIGNTTYDLPTLTDSQLPNLTGPFGGDFGRRQAKIVAGGPVQVYAPGFRTSYDIVITRSGRMYATDNGGNAGWGAPPVGNGTNACTNDISEPGVTDLDTLHLITGPGYYAGHPNPTRGNVGNTFGGQSPVLVANPIECTWLRPGTPENPAITTFDGSSNGIAEYTASNFAGAMNGDLLIANWNGLVYDVKLDASNGRAISNQALFAGVGTNPLSIATQGDGQPFRGVIFVVDQSGGAVTVFEPNDFTGSAPTCTGAWSTPDDDGDGYTNADEIANHTNTCSAGSVPHDWNQNHVSDLLDPNTDGDALPDVSDPFALDASNGMNSVVPFAYSWDNGAVSAQCAPTPLPSGCPGGLLTMGFTGVMNNGNSKYVDQYDTSNMTLRGAAGVLTVDKLPAGDALGAANSQQYAFQFGVKTKGVGTFTTHTRLMAPFAGIVPQGNQSFGMYIGTGDQDNYFKVVATANGGTPGVQAVAEVGGVVTKGTLSPVSLPSAAASAIDVYITITPSTGAVQGAYRLVDTSGTPGPFVPLYGLSTLPTSWFNSSSAGMAIGVIGTSSGGPTFTATWKGIDAFMGSLTFPPVWQSLAAAPTFREEVSEVYSPTTKKFYVAGGQATTHETYNPATDTWSTVAALPAALDHIQAVELNGKIYYIGGLSCWPNCSVGTVYIYNESTDTFTTGAPMPTGRDRGAGGVAVFNGKIYLAGGLHAGADVKWFDVYDPVANTWTSLPDMPEVRDHFQPAVIGSRFYAIGGRRSDQSLDATTTVNDAYDFTTNTWVTGLAPLPTARAGFAVGAVGTTISVIGGEGGNQTWTTVETYDTATDTWTTGTPMPTARHGIQGAVCNGGIYIAEGGTKEAVSGPTNVNQAYFPNGIVTACT